MTSGNTRPPDKVTSVGGYHIQQAGEQLVNEKPDIIDMIEPRIQVLRFKLTTASIVDVHRIGTLQRVFINRN